MPHSVSAYGVSPVAEEGGPGESPAVLAVSVRPNPTRGVVRLSLSLAEAGTVHVSVYDVLGREVSRGASPQPAGASEVVLDGSSWTPGVYVARVTTGNGQAATARIVRAE